MTMARALHPRRHYPGRLIVLLAVFLVIPTAAACAMPGQPSGVRQTATAADNCTAVQARDPVLTAGSLTVQPLYAEVLRYLDDAASHPNADRAQLWVDDVLSVSPQLYEVFSISVGGSKQAAEQTLSVTWPGDFRCVVADMERVNAGQIALQELEQDTSALGGPPTTLYLLPWPLSYTISNGASYPGTILVIAWENQPSARANLPTLASRWGRYIPSSVAHEDLEVTCYVRIGFDTANANLLAHLVTDGMADSFALARTHLSQLWDNAMSAQQERQVWQRIQPQLLSPQADQSAIMFGDPAQNYPLYAGYTIGFHIVQGYLARHPDASFATLAGMSTAAVYAGSGYTG